MRTEFPMCTEQLGLGKRPERRPVANADPAVVALRKDTFLCVHTRAVAGREPLPHAHNLSVAGRVSLSHTPPTTHPFSHCTFQTKRSFFLVKTLSFSLLPILGK